MLKYRCIPLIVVDMPLASTAIGARPIGPGTVALALSFDAGADGQLPPTIVQFRHLSPLPPFEARPWQPPRILKTTASSRPRSPNARLLASLCWFCCWWQLVLFLGSISCPRRIRRPRSCSHGGGPALRRPNRLRPSPNARSHANRLPRPDMSALTIRFSYQLLPPTLAPRPWRLR